MSEEHTRQLMVKYFPKCPICKSEANYSVSPSNVVVQCNSCKAKFSSEDFKDPRKDLIHLSLFSPPSTLINESLISTLKLMQNEPYHFHFWQNMKLNKTELEQQLAEYRGESQPLPPLPRTLFGLSKESVAQRAVQYMTARGYRLISRTESVLVFEDGKDLNVVILILGILFLLLGAIIYYLVSTKHTITVTISQTDKGTEVQCTTNTTGAMQIANDFLQSLPKT